MKNYIVTYESDNMKGRVEVIAHDKTEAEEIVLSRLSPNQVWVHTTEEDNFSEIVEKVNKEFQRIQKEATGYALFSIKKMDDAEFLPTYEIVLTDNLFIHRNGAAPLSEYGRYCINTLMAEQGIALSWNNTGDIFWKNKAMSEEIAKHLHETLNEVAQRIGGNHA